MYNAFYFHENLGRNMNAYLVYKMTYRGVPTKSVLFTGDLKYQTRIKEPKSVIEEGDLTKTLFIYCGWRYRH